MADGTSQTLGSQDIGCPQFYKDRRDFSPFLEQGDLIPRTAPIITEVLKQYHPYHVEKAANEMFAVLTQSCDLVKHNRSLKARYISLAPVRPLRLILEREFGSYLLKPPGDYYVLGSIETKGRYDDFLGKLINNNDSRYFFLPQRNDLQITEDMCVMLPLSLSIRAEHYESCVRDRVAQIDDLFQAKLGWLLGQQYSRVGTPDWTAEGLASKVKSVGERNLSWLPDHEFSQLKKAIDELTLTNPEAMVDENALMEMRKKIKTKRDLVVSAVINTLVNLKVLEPPPNKMIYTVRKELMRNSDIANYFPGS